MKRLNILFAFSLFLIRCNSSVKEDGCWNLERISDNISNVYNLKCKVTSSADTLIFDVVIDSSRVNYVSKAYSLRGKVLFNAFIANQNETLCHSIFKQRIYRAEDGVLMADLIAFKEHLFHEIFIRIELPELAYSSSILWNSVSSFEMFLLDGVFELHCRNESSPESYSLPVIAENFIYDRLRGINNGPHEWALQCMLNTIYEQKYQLNTTSIEHIMDFGRRLDARLDIEHEWPTWSNDLEYMDFLKQYITIDKMSYELLDDEELSNAKKFLDSLNSKN